MRGHKREPDGRTYLHHGTATRSFERQFDLADYVEVTDATMGEGLLVIDLKREVPEALKPRRIPIDSGVFVSPEAKINGKRDREALVHHGAEPTDAKDNWTKGAASAPAEERHDMRHDATEIVLAERFRVATWEALRGTGGRNTHAPATSAPTAIRIAAPIPAGLRPAASTTLPLR